MATMLPREQLLERLVAHLASCANCQDALHFGLGGPLCVNGERLWLAAQMPKTPEPGQIPQEWAPGDIPNTTIDWRSGPLVPPNERH